jgi:hypothetical protein
MAQFLSTLEHRFRAARITVTPPLVGFWAPRFNPKGSPNVAHISTLASRERENMN